MHKKHPAFEAPENEYEKIWRYIDFTKFVSLLEKKALFFCRSDLFEDPFEGSLSHQAVEARELSYEKLCIERDIPSSVFEQLLKTDKSMRIDIRKWMFINCWNIRDYESPALWNLHLKSEDGVAIQSTFRRLADSFNKSDETVHIGIVKYINYDIDWMPAENIIYPYLHKRLGFDYEKELRALVQRFFLTDKNIIDKEKTDATKGLTIMVDLDILIERIFVHPNSPQWFFDTVNSITKKFSLEKEIIPSKLAEPPQF